MDNNTPFNCQLCDETHVAAFKCVDCGDLLMCEFMQISHARGKLSKGHRIERLTITPTVSKGSSHDSGAAIICNIHNDVFRYYDHDCGVVICRDCYALSHTGHKCISIPDAAIEYRELLDNKTQELKETIDAARHTEGAITEVEEKLEKRYSELNERINKEFKEVRILL